MALVLTSTLLPPTLARSTHNSATGVAVVRMRVEPLGSDVPAQVGVVEVGHFQVRDVLEHRALDVLRHDASQVRAHAPIDGLDLVDVVAAHRQPAQQHEAPAVLQFAIDLPQPLARRIGQWEVGLAELSPAQSFGRDRGKRAIEIGNLIGGQVSTQFCVCRISSPVHADASVTGVRRFPSQSSPCSPGPCAAAHPDRTERSSYAGSKPICRGHRRRTPAGGNDSTCEVAFGRPSIMPDPLRTTACSQTTHRRDGNALAGRGIPLACPQLAPARHPCCPRSVFPGSRPP